MVAVGDRVTKETDDRGRLYLSRDLADESVTIEVIAIGDDVRRVTVCDDCEAVVAGLHSHCLDCGSESVRQPEVSDPTDD